MKESLIRSFEDQAKRYISKPSSSFFLKLFSFFKLTYIGVKVQYPTYIAPNGKIKSGKNIKIHKNCRLSGKIDLDDDVEIYQNCTLYGKTKIGKYSVINKNSELIGEVQMGKYCSIARNVTFQGVNHIMNEASTNIPFLRNLFKKEPKRVSKGPIMVGNDVWIGTKCIILSGVNIGDGAVVGAGSVLTKDVKPYSIVGGSPARHLKWRFPENIRNQLKEIKWWNWDDKKIKKNKSFFKKDLTKEDNLKKLIK